MCGGAETTCSIGQKNCQANKDLKNIISKRKKKKTSLDDPMTCVESECGADLKTTRSRKKKWTKLQVDIGISYREERCVKKEKVKRIRKRSKKSKVPSPTGVDVYCPVDKSGNPISESFYVLSFVFNQSVAVFEPIQLDSEKGSEQSGCSLNPDAQVFQMPTSYRRPTPLVDRGIPCFSGPYSRPPCQIHPLCQMQAKEDLDIYETATENDTDSQSTLSFHSCLDCDTNDVWDVCASSINLFIETLINEDKNFYELFEQELSMSHVWSNCE